MTQENDTAQGAGRAPRTRATGLDRAEPDRAERLRAALRDNLARRKTQARQRTAADGDPKDGGDPVARDAGQCSDQDGT